MFPPKTFDEYFNIAKELLSPGKADKSWINHINQMFKEKNLKQSLTNMYHINCITIVTYGSNTDKDTTKVNHYLIRNEKEVAHP